MTLVHLIFIWYCLQVCNILNFYVVLFPSPVGKFPNNTTKNPDCVIKSTFSKISNITFVQVLINLLMYYHMLLLNTLQHDFYPF